MYSNITDAWNDDPVKEITQKLSNRNTIYDVPDREKIFLFRPPEKNNTINISDIKSISLYSDTDSNNHKSYAYTNYPSKNKSNQSGQSGQSNQSNKYRRAIVSRKQPYKYTLSSTDNSYNSDTNTNLIEDTDTAYVHHIKKNRYNSYDKMKDIINSKVDRKVNKKFNQLILDNKINELQKTSSNLFPYKEMLIIIVILIAIIFIIVLLMKFIKK